MAELDMSAFFHALDDIKGKGFQHKWRAHRKSIRILWFEWGAFSFCSIALLAIIILSGLRIVGVLLAILYVGGTYKFMKDYLKLREIGRMVTIEEVMNS
jgi:hypothetical protein